MNLSRVPIVDGRDFLLSKVLQPPRFLKPSLQANQNYMQKLIFPLLFLAFFGTMSCSGKMDAGDVNLEKWKSDRYGCTGLRMQELEAFKAVKNNFLGADNQALIKTFGRPDRVELVDKSQSFFFYFIEPSGDCEGVKSEKEPLRVLFRMNAISKVSEVTITTLNP